MSVQTGLSETVARIAREAARAPRHCWGWLGALLAIETPNPECLAIFATHFYLDPTHRHPIPSELLSFVVEARGLCDPKVIPLSPYPDDFRLPAS